MHRGREACQQSQGLISIAAVPSRNLSSAAAADGGSPVGYWKLDEGSGIQVEDASGLGNHGSYEAGPVPSAVVAPLRFANPRSLAFEQTTLEDVSIPSIASLGLSGPLTLAPPWRATMNSG